jgi:hypothetical protein
LARSELAAKQILVKTSAIMLKLRTFLSSRHAQVLEPTGLLDEEVRDPLLEERMVRIRAQITAAMVLNGKLEEMGFQVAQRRHMTIDLASLVALAEEQEILTRKEAKVLMRINGEANEAKHALVFVSRV